MSKEMHPTPQEYFDSIKTDKMAIITLKQLCDEFLNIDVDLDIISPIINTIKTQLDKSKERYPHIKDKFTLTNYVCNCYSMCHNCDDGDNILSCIINDILHIEVKKIYSQKHHRNRYLITATTEHINVITWQWPNEISFYSSNDKSKINVIIQLLNDKMLSSKHNELDAITFDEFNCMLNALVIAS